MSGTFHFTGYVKNVTYTAQLAERLTVCDMSEFDINAAKSYGLIQRGDSQVAFSRWVSPKRTRSYPFERIYNTYNSAKVLTVIPVIKDEGRDGDLDRIQFSTISWMNLLNTYIVLGYYKTAKKNTSSSQHHRQKLNGQKFDNDFIKAQIGEVMNYKQSALHWNRSLFETRFALVFREALSAYQRIADATGVKIHNQFPLLAYLKRIEDEYAQFKDISLRASLGASRRELQTTHRLENLEDGAKATFYIENYLGGVYHLTADEIVIEDGRYIIQESKHSSRGSFPSVADIKDGLFKLILFSNLDTLHTEGKQVSFTTRLKLTAHRLTGSLNLPSSDDDVEMFVALNKSVLTKRQQEVVGLLQAEAHGNPPLQVLIKGVAER